MRDFPFINKFGVELEGGWNPPFPSSYLWTDDMDRAEPPYPECAVDEDGNDCDRCEDCDMCRDWDDYHNGDDDGASSYRHGDGSVTVRAQYVGEIATPPYTSFAKFKEDFHCVYPNEINSSCGMHVHISVNPHMGDVVSLYSSMMTPRFKEFIIGGMKRWAIKAKVREGSAFWRRIQGANTYCRDTWEPDEQARCTGRDSVRYSFINFCYRVDGRGTVEFRFLPMFESKILGEKSVKHLLSLTNAFLKVAAKQKFEHKADDEEIEVHGLDHPIEEEIILCSSC